MTDKKDAPIELEKHCSETSTIITSEIFTIINEQSKVYGTEAGRMIALSLLKNMTFVLLHDSLANAGVSEKMTNKEAEDLVKLSYATAKDGVQNAIADGFEAASVQYCGQSLGFYCKILTAGQPINGLAI